MSEPLKWRGKFIDELSDDELKAGKEALDNMFKTYENNKASDEYKKRYEHRELPPINPHFELVLKAITDKLENK